jgi:hypothetical protein
MAASGATDGSDRAADDNKARTDNATAKAPLKRAGLGESAKSCCAGSNHRPITAHRPMSIMASSMASIEAKGCRAAH